MSVWTPPDDLDPECLALCVALNALPGIRTIESCCGHGTDPFRIWLRADSLEDLPAVAWHLDWCHVGFEHWRLVAQTDCGMSPISFVVEGPAGAYGEADSIAAQIMACVTQLALIEDDAAPLPG